MHIIQFNYQETGRALGIVRDKTVHHLTAVKPAIYGVHAAFLLARRSGRRLHELLEPLVEKSPALNYEELLSSGKVLPPVTQDPGIRLLVSGTGLTHLGSVQQRDDMHKKPEPTGPKSDSRRMFEMGLQGGRPASGERGTSPEWFYKGDGRILRGPGQALDIPSFAPDGGEEPEIAVVYIVDDNGIPCRLGFTQGNEWSDHVTENINYLYLASSKMRTCSIGPELVTDLAFDDVVGRCRVLRAGQTIYDSGELRTGERNMCHSLRNIEDHHFKFPEHRTPGDIHVHFLGTSKLSFQHREWRYESGDIVEVAFEGLGAPLRNVVRRDTAAGTPTVIALG